MVAGVQRPGKEGGEGVKRHIVPSVPRAAVGFCHCQPRVAGAGGQWGGRVRSLAAVSGTMFALERVSVDFGGAAGFLCRRLPSLALRSAAYAYCSRAIDEFFIEGSSPYLYVCAYDGTFFSFFRVVSQPRFRRSMCVLDIRVPSS